MPINTYTKEHLLSFIKDNNVCLYDDEGNKLDINKTTFYDCVKRETQIYYECMKEYCTTCSNKSLRRLFETGAFCQKHIQENRIKKIEEKCLLETGYKNPLLNPAIQKKIINTNYEKYGTYHPMKNKDISKNMSETIKNKNKKDPLRQQIINDKKIKSYMETLGVEHPSQSDIIKKKKENTNLENLGVTHPAKSKDVLKKMKNTYKEKTGFDSVSSNPAVRKKAQDTMEKRFGFRFPTQNPALMHKAFTNSFRLKTYTFPSGITTTYMGYENFAIDYLINKENINEDDIYTENLTQFIYRKPNENKDRYYTPDIFIKSQNRYIEVKSTYTITQDTENILRKQDAIKNLNIVCEIWVMNNKGILVNKYL
jgi:hypothetical protein